MEIWKFWKRISVDKIQCCGGGKIFIEKIKIFMEKIKIFIEKIIRKPRRKSLRNYPNRCQRVSKANCKKPAKFQTAVSIYQFLCARMLQYILTRMNNTPTILVCIVCEYAYIYVHLCVYIS